MLRPTYLNTVREVDPAEFDSPNLKPQEERTIYQYKVILLGDIAVGKTSLLRRFVENEFTTEYYCTVGVEFRIKTIMVNSKVGADLKIWDTCGEEKYRTITRQYYRDSNGVLLVFDLSNAASFEKLEEWYEDVVNSGPKDLHIVLVGNKKDLSDREVTEEMVKNFMKDHKGMEYVETSAATGEGVSDAFKKLAEKLITWTEEKENEVNKENQIPDFTDNTIQLNDPKLKKIEAQQKKGGCC